MYETILVPLDGSEVAASVLPYVQNLAKGLGSKVTLLTALEPDGGAARGAETEARAEAEAVARREAQHLSAAGVDTSTRVVSGKPAEQIVGQAREGGFGLVIMGTRGHSGIRRGLVGSVTDEVVRTSLVPVLVLSPLAVEKGAESGHRLTTLVVPLDGSDLAEGILPYAEALAKALSLEVHLVRVVSVGSLAYYAGEGVTMDTTPLEEELEEDAASYLEQVVQRLSRRELTVSATVIKGSPALALNDTIRETPNTVVAICTHGRSGLGRALIGSVADSIIRSSGAPVLVLTPQPAS